MRETGTATPPLDMSTITTLKEWNNMLEGPLPVVALFTEAAGKSGRLEGEIQHAADKHKEKARFFLVEETRVPEVVEAAGAPQMPAVRVYKGGKLVGQPLSDGQPGDIAATVMRYVERSS